MKRPGVRINTAFPVIYTVQEKALEKIIGPDVLIDRMTASFIKEKFFSTGEDGTRMNQRMKTFKAIGRRLSTHALRHTYVSLSAAAGVPFETISRHVGHAGEEITRIYLHVTDQMTAKDNARLDEAKLL